MYGLKKAFFQISAVGGGPETAPHLRVGIAPVHGQPVAVAVLDDMALLHQAGQFFGQDLVKVAAVPKLRPEIGGKILLRSLIDCGPVQLRAALQQGDEIIPCPLPADDVLPPPHQGQLTAFRLPDIALLHAAGQDHADAALGPDHGGGGGAVL